jgi:hypothetical protein
MADGRSRLPGQTHRGSGSGSKASLTLKQRLREAFTERLPYKAAAIFFALVLWLIVSAEEPTSGPVPVQFEVAMDTSVQLTSGLPNVTAYVVGSRSDLLRLTATPLTLHMRVPEDSPDSLVVRLADVPLTQPNGVDVRIQRLQPETVTLRFVTEARRTLPVRSALRLVDDFGRPIATTPQIEPESVAVVGPRRRVRTLDSIPTVAADLIVRDTTAYAVALDTANLGVRVTPAQVRVRVPAPVPPDTVPPPDTTPPGPVR